jgi:putative PEP-CTERM system TPR-repeat lipoprotein
LPLAKALAASDQHARLLALRVEDFSEAERPALRTLRGNAYLALRRTGAALGEYSEALAEAPQFSPARVGIVEAYLAAADLDNAEGALAQLGGVEPSTVAILTAQLANARGLSERAEAALRAVLPGNDPAAWRPTDLPVLFSLVDTLTALGRSADAVATTEQMVRLAPNVPVVRYRRARAAYDAGDYERAAREVGETLQLAPEFRPALVLQGAVAYRQGYLETADTQLSAAVVADPRDENARHLLGEVRKALGRPAEVSPELERGSAGASRDASLLALGALAGSRVGRFDEAVEYLEATLETDRSRSGLQMQVAAGHLAAGRREAALDVLQRVPDDDPNAFRRDVIVMLTDLEGATPEAASRRGAELVADWPQRSDAYVLAASLASAAGEDSRARELLSRAVALERDNLAANAMLGGFALADGDLGLAEQHFATVLARDQSAETAHIALAEIAFQRDGVDSALAVLERARGAIPRGVAVRAALARQLLLAGRAGAALEVAHEAADLAPQSALILELAAAAELAAGYPAEAVPLLERVAAIREVATIHRELARAKIAAGDSPGAEASLRRALAIDARDTAAIVMLGELDLRAGRVEDALQRASEAAAMAPDDASAALLHGNVLATLRDFAQAEGEYERALALAPSTIAAVKLYQVKSALGRTDALDVLIDRARVAANDTSAHLALALAYQARGENPAAIARFRRVIDLDPDNAVAWNNVAWLYHLAGNRGALPAARRAAELRPDEGAILDTLGWLLAESGDEGEALPLLRRAATLLADNAEVQYHLAAVLARTGASAEARVLLERIIRTQAASPSRAAAEELLRSL